MNRWKYKIKKRPFDREYTSILTYTDADLPGLAEEFAARGYVSILLYREHTDAAHIPPRGETTGADKFDVAGQIADRRVQSKLQ